MREKLFINQNQIPLLQMIIIGLLPNFCKKIIYYLKRYNIGKGVKFGIGSIISGQSVSIEEGTKIGFGTIIAGKMIKIGRYVKIGSLTYINVNNIDINDDARINNQVYIGGTDFPDSEIKIGKRTIIMENTFLNPTCSLHIGDDTGIGGKCSIFTHGSWQSQLEGYPVKFAPVKIGKNVWIPWDVFILPGVTIGDNATIGAASLIIKDIPEGAIAAGVPAKVLKTKESRIIGITDTERKILFRNYLKEFSDYLKFNNIILISYRILKDYTIYIFKFKKIRYSIIYTEKKINWKLIFIDEKIKSKSAVCISYLKIDNTLRSIIINAKQMWIDIEKIERSRESTSIGEQLLKYLSRYGVRFSESST